MGFVALKKINIKRMIESLPMQPLSSHQYPLWITTARVSEIAFLPPEVLPPEQASCRHAISVQAYGSGVMWLNTSCQMLARANHVRRHHYLTRPEIA